MTSRLRVASSIANAITGEQLGPWPGLIVLFDGDTFAGALPITNWSTCFQDALQAQSYDSAVLVCFDPPPPVSELQDQAACCSVTYQGAVHDRPIKLAGVQYPATAATGTARMLH